MNPRNDFDVILTCNYSPWSSYRGGGQKSVHMLATAMAAEGKKVCVVFSKVPWEKVSVPTGITYDVAWAWFVGLKPGVSSPLRFLNGLPFYLKVRRRSGPRTLLIGNGDEASLLWRIRRRGKFAFANRNTYEDFLRGLDWTRPRTWLRIFFTEPRYIAIALAARNADVTTCSSRFSVTQLTECFGVPETRVAVIPNGLDPFFFTREFREDGQKGVLFFGRLAVNKGAHLALEAYARLPEDVRTMHPLIFAGNGPLEERLRKTIREFGLEKDVIFAGWLANDALAQAITACRVVLLPSQEESFGNAILETLATGQNLVSTTACAIPEVAGPYGTLVECTDVEAMTAALLRELPRVRAPEEIAAQRNYFRDKFSWSTSARRFLELGGR